MWRSVGCCCSLLLLVVVGCVCPVVGCFIVLFVVGWLLQVGVFVVGRWCWFVLVRFGDCWLLMVHVGFVGVVGD